LRLALVLHCEVFFRQVFNDDVVLRNARIHADY
jgi:hypothetical protein